MKHVILIGTILIALLSATASNESTTNVCLTCMGIDTIIPSDTLERIKREAVIDATLSMMERVNDLQDTRDSLRKVVDSMMQKPKCVLGRIDTIREVNGSLKLWKWFYWQNGKKYKRFSHVEISPL